MFHFANISLRKIALFLLTMACCFIYMMQPTIIQLIRNNLFDHYQQWHPRDYQDVGVKIIDIDDESLQKIGQWPWPRTLIADILKNLNSAQIKAIGFDVIFAEPDRTAPASVIKYWQVPAEIRTQLQALPDPDQQLSEVFKTYPVVLGFSAEHKPNVLPLPAQPFRFVTLNHDNAQSVNHFESAITSMPLLEASAKGNGALIFTSDNDGMLRRVPLVIQIQDHLYPSFAAELTRVAFLQKNYLLKSSPKPGLGVEQIILNNLVIPTNEQGEIWVYYSKPNPERVIPAWKMIQGEIPPESLKESILLVGTSAKGVMDQRFTPVAGKIPGIEVHAQIVEQILTRNFLTRPNWAMTLEVLSLFLGALLVGMMAFSRRLLVSLSIFFSVEVFLLVGSWFVFTHEKLLLDGLTPSLLVLVVFMLSSLTRHFHSEQQQRWIRNVFSRYVSPNLVSYLIANPNQLELSGQRLECSFILTDLANSTQFMEYTEPTKVASLLNQYLDQMISIAFSYEGTLTRIIGDGIVIMFSAPVPQADHRQRAVSCALEMHQYSQNYLAELKARGGAFCETRIGVNTGMVLVGNFGGQSIFDYRALGDPINTASRLESVNRYLGTRVCVSENTLEGCQNIISRPIGRLLLKGKTKALMTFEPLGVSNENATVTPDVVYEQAYLLLKNNHTQEALAAFEQLHEKRPEDKLIAFHAERLKRGESGDLIVIPDK